MAVQRPGPRLHHYANYANYCFVREAVRRLGTRAFNKMTTYIYVSVVVSSFRSNYNSDIGCSVVSQVFVFKNVFVVDVVSRAKLGVYIKTVETPLHLLFV